MDKILFVDDDKNILSYFKRRFYKKFETLLCDDPIKGIEIVKKIKNIAVVISDMKMPNMDGISFLKEVKKLSPNSVRVLFTGYADLDNAILAVNKGSVFKFLTKPCDDKIFEDVIQQCVKQYKLIIAEKELITGTLIGSINLLSDILSLVNPEAFGRASRIKRLVKWFVNYFKVKGSWRYEMAATLSQIGCVMVPQETLKKVYQGKELSGEERQLYEMYPSIGQSLLKNIPRLEEVAKMILYQEKHYNGGGIPKDDIKGEQIPLGSRFLKVALDFDLLENRGVSKPKIYKTMVENVGVYDPKVLKALEEYLGEEARYEIKRLPLKDIFSGMIFGEEVRTKTGLLLISRGYEANMTVLLRLRNFAEKHGINEPIKVLIPV